MIITEMELFLTNQLKAYREATKFELKPECLSFLSAKIEEAVKESKVLRISKSEKNPFPKGFLVNEIGQVFLNFPKEEPRKGAYKRVRKSYFIDPRPNSQTGYVVAKNTPLEPSPIFRKQVLEKKFSEAKAMKSLQHIKGVLPVISYFHYKNKKNKYEYVFFQPYLKEDLHSLLYDKDRASPTEEVLIKIAHQLLETCASIEKEGGIHADIKTDNIVLNDENDPFLIDFGAYYSKENSNKATLLGGAVHFRCPEILKAIRLSHSRLTYGDDTLRKKLDVWSLGVVIWSMFSKKGSVSWNSFFDKSLQSEEKKQEPRIPIKREAFLLDYICDLTSEQFEQDLRATGLADHWITPLLRKMLDINPESRISLIEAQEQFNQLLPQPS